MIALSTFLQAVKQNAARVTKYHQPGDGSDGLCDCIGLIIGAVRLAGGQWTGTHGSNYAARFATDEFGPAKFFIGEIVYKARKPGEPYYDLPDKYKNGGDRYTGDLLDYYHVGVVINDSPLKIIHCTSPGPIAIDTKKGKWAYGGKLKGVVYSNAIGPLRLETETEVVKMNATVYAENGKPVKMRAKPNTSTNVYWDVPVGAIVEVLDNGETWSKIVYGSRTGYMMTKFLKIEEENVTYEEELDAMIGVHKGDLTAAYEKIGELLKQFVVNKGELEKVYDSLGNMLGLRG